MKEHKWDEAAEVMTEVFEPSLTMANDEKETRVVEKKRKSQLTQLRRRIEERLDTKRITMEFDEF
ncbi:MAG: hypothetical protein ACJZ79_05400 [Pseudohongiellaceae bacterium]